MGEEGSTPAAAEVWGYSFLANFLITLAAGIGILLVPLLSKTPKLGHYAIVFLVALAIGVLLGDTFFHLIPAALGVHGGHGEEEVHAGERRRRWRRLAEEGEATEEHSESNKPIWLGLATIGAIYAFFLIEKALHSWRHRREEQHEALSSPREARFVELGQGHANPRATIRTMKPIGWLILLGDAVHNFVDGILIGAAFSVSVRTGVSTSLAVLLHELPAELSDYAVLLSAGLDRWTALGLNMASNATSFVGSIIGILLVDNTDDAVPWVLSITAGIFLYIALTDLLPELHRPMHEESLLDAWKPKEETVVQEEKKAHKVRWILSQAGLLIGVLVMLLLELFWKEEH